MTPPGASSRATLPPPILPGATVPAVPSPTPAGAAANRDRLIREYRARLAGGAAPTGAAPIRGTKRTAEAPPDDPRLVGEGAETETVTEPRRGIKRDAEDPPDDPRLVGEGPEVEIAGDMPTPTGQPSTHRPASSISKSKNGLNKMETHGATGQPTSKGQDALVANESTDSSDGDQVRANDDSRPGHTCATCGQKFETRNRLHRHLRDANHCVIDDHDDRPELCNSSDDDDDDVRERSNEQRRLQASRVRQAVLDHFAGGEPMNDKSDPDGSVTGSPPDTDDGRLSVAAHDQDASGRETGKPKPINSVGRSHPGAKVASKDVTSRDQQWVDIGSGIVSRTFIGAEKLMTTSRGGPNIIDIQHRKVWSLTSGKLLHECDVNDVTDEELNKQLPAPDNIRVELTLRNALKLFERRGPDVAEIFSQPRVCQEVGGRRFQGEELRPGWSLDLTMNDPKTGKPWDLSQSSVQSRVRKLVRSTKPYCLIGSPPCTPFSPLQEISRAKRDPKVMAEEL